MAESLRKKTKAQALIELMEKPSTREMLKKTDSIGGQLRSGWKKCSI
jgi:hypothetical protein